MWYTSAMPNIREYDFARPRHGNLFAEAAPAFAGIAFVAVSAWIFLVAGERIAAVEPEPRDYVFEIARPSPGAVAAKLRDARAPWQMCGAQPAGAPDLRYSPLEDDPPAPPPAPLAFPFAKTGFSIRAGRTAPDGAIAPESAAAQPPDRLAPPPPGWSRIELFGPLADAGFSMQSPPADAVDEDGEALVEVETDECGMTVSAIALPGREPRGGAWAAWLAAVRAGRAKGAARGRVSITWRGTYAPINNEKTNKESK